MAKPPMPYAYDAPASDKLYARAQELTPGGVNSPVRAYGAVGGTPRFAKSGKGACLVDADGREYVDFVNSWGAAILGHAHSAVVSALQEAATKGTSFGAPTEAEVLLAEEIAGRVRCIERLRLVNSGTEATMSAIRLARGFTNRPKVVKFAGCYHGHVDALLAQAGSGVATFGLPGSSGVTDAQVSDTIVLPYNNLDAVREAFADHSEQIACVITEAAPGNMGVVPPKPGFNATVKELCSQHGALFISDEVMTGFRVSPSGWYGIESVEPDLITFGKVMGGGLSAAAFGGRADVMQLLAPDGPVYQAGTLSGNPLATAAGLATLRHCTDEVYARLDAASDRVTRLVTEALSAEGVPHTVQRAGNLFSVFFTENDVTDFASAKTTDANAYATFFHAMLASGVNLPPSPYEAWFVSAAFDDSAVERVAEALLAAARKTAEVCLRRLR